MHLVGRTALAGFSALLTLSAAQAQEGVLLRMNQPAGHATRYRMEVRSWLPMGMMPGMQQMMQGMPADTSAPTMVQTLYTTDSVTALEGEIRVVSTVIDSAQMDMPGMPAMGAMMGGAAGMLRGMTTVRRVDPRGRVHSFEITNPGQMGAMGAMGMGRARGGMMQGGGTRSHSFTLPEGPVRVGDTWTASDTTTMPAGPGQQAQGLTQITYRLERIERQRGARIAVVSMSATITSVGEEMGVSGTLAGEVAVDLDAKRMTRMSMDMNAQLQSPEMGTMPIRSRVTATAL